MELCETKDQIRESSSIFPQYLQKACPGQLRALLGSWSTCTRLGRTTDVAIRTDKDLSLLFGVFPNGLVDAKTIPSDAHGETDNLLALTKWDFGARCSLGPYTCRQVGLLKHSQIRYETS